jgi:uncharacterized protein (DUF169 family)
MDTNINHLLEKYYKGETSLEEEKFLRNALSFEEAQTEDSYSSSLIFKTFNEEREAPAPDTLKNLYKTRCCKRKSGYYKKWIYAAASIAACLAVVFSIGLHYLNQHDYGVYIIIDGVRYNDEKLAKEYLNKICEEENRIEEMTVAQLDEMCQMENELYDVENQINDNLNYNY